MRLTYLPSLSRPPVNPSMFSYQCLHASAESKSYAHLRPMMSNGHASDVSAIARIGPGCWKLQGRPRNAVMIETR
jgi:hypothetical protein